MVPRPSRSRRPTARPPAGASARPPYGRRTAALTGLATLGALGALATVPRPAAAQGLEGYGGGAKIYFGQDSSRFLRVLLWSQVWTRWQELNPGTAVNRVPDQQSVFDVGIRRTRILMHGQITPRILVFWIIGANNQTFNSGGLQGGDIGGGTSGIDGKRPQVFVHDSWGEFKVSNALHIGGGVLTWSGLSRMTNAATLNFLMVDAPIYNWTTIDASDQFARTMGLYAKGTVAKRLNYRAVLTKPFFIAGGQQAGTATANLPASAGGGTVTVPIGDNAATTALVATPPRFNIANWNPIDRSLMPQFYVNWDFWDVESSTLPFMVGSYLGTRKVFNIGAGFQYHPTGMRFVRARDSVTVGTGAAAVRRAVLPTDAPNPRPVGMDAAGVTNDAVYNGDWVDAPMRNFAVDAFLDRPIGTGGSAVTWHGVWYNLDYGPNYVRNIGIMPVGTANPANRVAAGQPNAGQFQFEQPAFNGPSAAYPIHGTGNVVYQQAGFLLPRRMTKGFGRLQPTGALSYVNFERLGESYLMPELGFNWIFAGQNAKIQFQWRNRPLYESAALTRDGLAPTAPTTVGGATNQVYPLQTGMRRMRNPDGSRMSRQDVIVQFHVHL